jgi:RimJ/RimL family protein N-acetyltransferase
MSQAPELGFRPVRKDDLPLLYEWLQREHVRRWWHEDETLEDVVARYLPSIDGRDPVRPFVAQREGRDIGYVQTYLVDDEPEWQELVQVGPHVAGVDLFIAEPELLGKGIGPQLLRRFLDEIVFADPATSACIADPELGNAASIRAFEKAGFRRVREFVYPKEGTRHVLLRIERDPAA